MIRRGRKSAAQTPAPKKEQVYGSSKNPVGSAASKTSASKIQLSESIVKTLEDKRNDFNDNHLTKKVSLATLKAVMRRGMGAYSTSHRPTISGGAPNSRQAWGFARVNKFLLKKGGTKVKAAYVQDDDLMEKGGEIELLAPNGKKSNLTPEQHNLVRTPEFKAWFGDWENDPENASKVVDENGEPLVCYHATNENFTIFDKNKSGTKTDSGYFGKGFYFSPNINGNKTYGERVIKVFLNVKNPKYTYSYNLDPKNRIATIVIRGEYDFIKNKKISADRINEIQEIVVFEPNDIKLADGTNTTFDAENPDIRYEEGGLIAPNGNKSNLNPEQYKLVRTPQFKAWFGDWEKDPQNASKVVDENGEPLVVYHRSNDNFNVFDKGKNRLSTYGKGLYFTNLKNEYSKKGKYLYQVFLNLKSPLIIDIKNQNFEGEVYELLKFERDFKLGAIIKNPSLRPDDQKVYDLGERTYYVADNSTQIKLADGSNTTFDAENPDIRYEDGGKMFSEEDGLYVIIKDVKEENRYKGAYKKIFDIIEEDVSFYNPYGTDYEEIINGNLHIYITPRPEAYIIEKIKKMAMVEVVEKKYQEGGETGQEITCVRCGWNWNTSDSEEYDKYVCHNCGFDNRTFYDSDPIGIMKKKIALPDTYSSYESLKRVLADQGYAINKIDMELPVGKLAKGMSLSEVAAVHKLKADDLKGELKIGIETEMEHTDLPEYARAIALDHLYEDPKYYTKLKKMEGIDSHYDKISKKYADGGSIDPIFSFKTPTGETSRLNYLQQVLVRTKGFKDFFGDWEGAAKAFLLDGKQNFEKHYKNVSKVIDYVTLEPRVVYHGTRAQDEFFRFDVTKEKGVGRPYGYFAHNKEYSENFTKFSQRTTRETKPFLYECFISIRNPFYATAIEYWQKNRDADGWKTIISGTISYDKYKTIERNSITKQIEDNVESQIGRYIETIYSSSKSSFWRLMAGDIEKDFKYFLMSYEYDGVFYGEEISADYDPENPAQYTQAVTIFDSKQVKLADGRNLNFNPLLDDIRYEEGGYMPESEEPINIPIMNKKAKLGMLITGGKYEVGGTLVTAHGSTNDAKKGGYFHGRSHADGGIKAINKDTGQMIEVEGEEVIITKGAVNDETKREFEGEMLSNREILSRINQSGGGVAFEDGGELKPSTCGCSGKKYKYGGQMLEDFQIIRFMNDPQKLSSHTIKNSREFADSLISKLK